MQYSPNPTYFSSVFVLPGVIADKYLPLASAAQLKVILALYRTHNEVFDTALLCKQTGLSASEVLDACEYWVSQGVLTTPENPAPAAQPALAAASVAAPAVSAEANKAEENDNKENIRKTPEKITVSPSRPTHEQICQRLDASEALRELFNEAQSALGRLLGTGDQAALLLLYDYYGLPADVILMLCEYARTAGKAGNLNYIYSIGVNWSEREIDTFERADEELRRLAEVDANWTSLCKLTGLQHAKPTKGQQKYLSDWLNVWKFSLPMIALAYEKMTEHTDGVRFSYMNGILKNWYTKGIATPEQVQKEEETYRKQIEEKKAEKANPPKKQNIAAPGISPAAAKSGIADGPASYDLDKAEKAARSTVPVLRKRK